MRRKSDLLFVTDMLKWAQTATEFCCGKTLQDIQTIPQNESHLIRALCVIGEAASRVSQEFRDSYPDIPWQRMTAMRNRLVHAYSDIDMVVVWSTAIEKIPELIPQLEFVLLSERDENKEF
ncbi:MAG: DUF86 domain-containing protein [Candidatus Hydrogenedentes bacterium]|nr:DUF86 domain-containing protein [Candidatus Hydrogenedentota bacterium]